MARALATSLFVLLAFTVARAVGEAQADEAALRILVLRPGTAAPPAGFEELVGALQVMVQGGVTVAVIPATPPDTGDVVAWGASVARSEGADAVLWLMPSGAETVMWVVRVDGESPVWASFSHGEPRVFDRARALALAARPLLAPAVPAATTEPQPGGEAARVDVSGGTPETEETPSTSSSAPAQVETLETPEATRAVEADPSSPHTSSARPHIVPRVGLGPTLRNHGLVAGARLMLELGFLRRGWVHLTGELLRSEEEQGRQRAQGVACMGAEFSRGRFRGRLGVGLGLAAAWIDGQEASARLLVTAIAAAAVRTGPELFLEIPVTLEGTPNADALPGVQVSIGLLMGLSP